MTTSAIDTAVKTITTEHEALTVKLATLDTKYGTDRAAILTLLAPLAKALVALTGKPEKKVSGATRRPMSEEGKANIRKALEARKARLSGTTEDKPAEVPATPSEVTQKESKPKSGKPAKEATVAAK